VKLAEDGKVDIVTCLDVNCLWPDQPSQLRQAFTKLKPGGLLAMRVVDKSWMFSLGLAMHRMAPRLSNSIMLESVNDHRFSMSVKSLISVLTSFGFDVTYASPRGAMHSKDTRWPAKLSFIVGSILWSTTGIFLAPGAVILARKPMR
jgi:hypothetical protein